MPPVKNLQQRLGVVHPDITALDVGQFVEQHGAQLERGQFVRELLREKNDGPPQTANGGAASRGGKFEPHPPHSYLLAAGFEQIQKGTPEVPAPTLAALENSELFNIGAKLMKPEEKLKSYDGLYTDAYVR